MKKLFLFIGILCLSLAACRKCYTCKDSSGNTISEVCGKSEKDEMEKNGATCVEKN